MAILPERVWSKKSPVFHKKKAVWKKGSKLWVYDPQFKEVSSWEIYPSDKWEDVWQNDELQIYESLETGKIIKVIQKKSSIFPEDYQKLIFYSFPKYDSFIV